MKKRRTQNLTHLLFFLLMAGVLIFELSNSLWAQVSDVTLPRTSHMIQNIGSTAPALHLGKQDYLNSSFNVISTQNANERLRLNSVDDLPLQPFSYSTCGGIVCTEPDSLGYYFIINQGNSPTASGSQSISGFQFWVGYRW